MNLNKIKLFCSDIDGVWTDGGMFYDQRGNELKKFNTYDSMGVLLLREVDIPFVIVSGEETEIVRTRAKKLKIENVFLGVKNKVQTIERFINKMDIKWDEIAFIGDDMNDVPLLKKVGFSACPKNAPEFTKQVVNWISPVKGGDGAFRSFVEYYLNSIDMLDLVLEKYIEKNY